MSDIEFEFLRKETVVAGGLQYETDRLLVDPPEEVEPFEANHIERECPNCAAIGELAIELRTDSLFCPICEHRRAFNPDEHLVSAVEIDDHSASDDLV